MQCTNCNGEDFVTDNGELTCCSCGLVARTHDISSVPVFEQQQTFRTSRVGKGNKLTKMQEWYMWSNEDKNRYKLTNYTTTLCSKLDIQESLVPDIVDIVLMVMEVIKKNDGTKRARVKDAIIIMCIHYYSKNTRVPINYMDLAKKIDLELKYITKAERIILELMNTNKLVLDKKVVLQSQKPYDYVIDVINKKHIKVPENVLDKVKQLIELCDKNDILLDHTPLSVGVTCFYYVLKTMNINFDVEMFTKMYDLSMVTVLKTHNKLKQYLQAMPIEFE